jgi:hypothetical protein
MAAHHSAMVVGIVVLMVVMYLQVSAARTERVYEISAPRGTLLTTRTIGRPIADAIRFVHERTAPGEYLASLPQGSIVNFLAERAQPLREEIINPGLLTPDREAEAIERMSALRVRMILVANVLSPEYGATAFWGRLQPSADAVGRDELSSDCNVQRSGRGRAQVWRTDLLYSSVRTERVDAGGYAASSALTCSVTV